MNDTTVTRIRRVEIRDAILKELARQGEFYGAHSRDRGDWFDYDGPINIDRLVIAIEKALDP